jgi:hypothetical protein
MQNKNSKIYRDVSSYLFCANIKLFYYVQELLSGFVIADYGEENDRG